MTFLFFRVLLGYNGYAGKLRIFKVCNLENFEKCMYIHETTTVVKIVNILIIPQSLLASLTFCFCFVF